MANPSQVDLFFGLPRELMVRGFQKYTPLEWGIFFLLLPVRGWSGTEQSCFPGFGIPDTENFQYWETFRRLFQEGGATP